MTVKEIFHFKKRRLLYVFTLLFALLAQSCTQKLDVEVLVVGGGASGVAAGVQSARMGVQTLIIEETSWL